MKPPVRRHGCKLEEEIQILTQGLLGVMEMGQARCAGFGWPESLQNTSTSSQTAARSRTAVTARDGSSGSKAPKTKRRCLLARPHDGEDDGTIMESRTGRGRW